MGLFTNLQRSFAYHLKPSQFVAWIDAVSTALDNTPANLPNNGSFDGIASGAIQVNSLTVAQLAPLKAGDLIWIQTIKSFARWDPTSTLTADGIAIINPPANAANAGRFIRELQIVDPSWRFQLSWFIDPVGGNDENSGVNVGAPLKTGAEFSRRVYEQQWTEGVYGIFVLNDIVAPDYIRIQKGFRNKTSTITIHPAIPGQGKAVLASGQWTARTSQARAANTRGQATDATITWANFLSTTAAPARRIRLTSGANVGTIFWPQKDLGAGAVAISQVTLVPAFNGVLPATGTIPTESTIAGNETYVIESLTKIAEFEYDVNADDDSTVNVSGCGAYIESIDFQGAMVGVYGSDNSFAFIGCCGLSLITTGAINKSLFSVVNCQIPAGIINGPTTVALWACHQTGQWTPQSGARVNIDGDTISQGGAGLCLVRRGGTVRIGTAAAFDSTGVGIDIANDGAFRNDTISAGAALAWGNGNATFGIRVLSGGAFVYQTKPIITGTTNDTSIGGVATAYAGVPAVTAANNAMIVLSA